MVVRGTSLGDAVYRIACDSGAVSFWDDDTASSKCIIEGVFNRMRDSFAKVVVDSSDRDDVEGYWKARGVPVDIELVVRDPGPCPDDADFVVTKNIAFAGTPTWFVLVTTGAASFRGYEVVFESKEGTIFSRS